MERRGAGNLAPPAAVVTGRAASRPGSGLTTLRPTRRHFRGAWRPDLPSRPGGIAPRRIRGTLKAGPS
eukprot:8073149-Alexandrium_andersonii.AAC.1